MGNAGLPGVGAAGPGLERGTIDVAGIRRTYWLARALRAGILLDMAERPGDDAADRRTLQPGA
jgi:hypothetical protein